MARPCGAAACDRFVIVTQEWGPCSHACGEGVSHRTRMCVLVHNMLQVDESFCSHLLPSYPTTRTCNLQSCDVYRFKTSEWSACSSACAGTRTRSIACVLSSMTGDAAVDEAVPVSHCYGVAGVVVPSAEETCEHDGASCFCFQNDCSGHGTCLGGKNRCLCDSGYTGLYCQHQQCSSRSGGGADANQTASGVKTVPMPTDASGMCCSGVLKPDKSCCDGVDAVLDAKGACCASSTNLDACGVCDGNATVRARIMDCDVFPDMIYTSCTLCLSCTGHSHVVGVPSCL